MKLHYQAGSTRVTHSPSTGPPIPSILQSPEPYRLYLRTIHDGGKRSINSPHVQVAHLWAKSEMQTWHQQGSVTLHNGRHAGQACGMRWGTVDTCGMPSTALVAARAARARNDATFLYHPPERIWRRTQKCLRHSNIRTENTHRISRDRHNSSISVLGRANIRL